MKKILVSCVFLFLAVFAADVPAHAEVLKGTNYQVLDPVVSIGGERATSTNFILFQMFGQLGLGTSTATNFQLNPGFLSFPVVTLPTATATAGDGQADLSWTSSSGKVGWTVAGYSVGQSGVSGGPYSYTSVGNVTSSTRTGLSNGTTYYFVILPEDAFGNRIATSTEVSATPVASPSPAPSPAPPRGGGGPPGSIQTGNATAVFRGRAYPESTVTLLEGTFRRLSTIADAAGTFELAWSALTEGIHTFGITAEDPLGRQSRLVSITVDVPANETVAVPDIFLPPTISLDKRAVRVGDPLLVQGASAPGAEVTVLLTSRDTALVVASFTAIADHGGLWSRAIDTTGLSFGEYSIRGSAFKDGSFSSLSSAVSIVVGRETIVVEPTFRPEKGDLNNDSRVNLADFSIAAFYYGKKPLGVFAERERLHLNGDGVVDLKDFSLLAYYWTG